MYHYVLYRISRFPSWSGLVQSNSRAEKQVGAEAIADGIIITIHVNEDI
jgi:hypothetical protein